MAGVKQRDGLGIRLALRIGKLHEHDWRPRLFTEYAFTAERVRVGRAVRNERSRMRAPHALHP
ncbi:MAG: hypothetical protein RJA70_1810 [Pseudomonadota bacterium]|jgi:hypothetical protein